MDKIQKIENCVRMFVAIVKTLDDESTRFIGCFNGDRKYVFKNLLHNINSFKLTIKDNMDPENINECEKIQDYLHDLVYGLIEEGKNDLHIFCAMFKALKTIYYKYIYNNFKHKDNGRFLVVINNASLFCLINDNSGIVNLDFENFCLTLIEGQTFERTVINNEIES